MKKSLPLLATHLRVCIAQNETNGGEKVTLARTVTADDDIVFGRKGFNDGLVLVTMIPSVSTFFSIMSAQYHTS
jgi:hypothetical protein